MINSHETLLHIRPSEQVDTRWLAVSSGGGLRMRVQKYGFDVELVMYGKMGIGYTKARSRVGKKGGMSLG